MPLLACRSDLKFLPPYVLPPPNLISNVGVQMPHLLLCRSRIEKAGRSGKTYYAEKLGTVNNFICTIFFPVVSTSKEDESLIQITYFSSCAV